MAIGHLTAPTIRSLAPNTRHAVPPISLRCSELPPITMLARWRGNRVPVQPAAAASSQGFLASKVQCSKDLIQEQQQLAIQAHAQPYDLAKTRSLVEAAMLAAVTGLAYTLGTLLKVEGYLGYFLPLPVIIAALRSGPTAGTKAATTAFLLLFILMGPVKAVTYLLIYGLLSLALGSCWSARLPWAVSIPLAAAARMVGYLSYVKLASWVTNEDLMALIITNVHSLLDQLSSTLGSSGAPSFLAVSITIGSLLLVNSLVYVAMMHVLYSILLRGMGLEMSPMPAPVQRYVYSNAAVARAL